MNERGMGQCVTKKERGRMNERGMGECVRERERES